LISACRRALHVGLKDASRQRQRDEKIMNFVLQKISAVQLASSERQSAGV